jgi:fatty-acyl-CoA synthase
MGKTMTGRLIQPTPSAYRYPLIIKNLLHQPLARSPDREIVYRDIRHTYRTFRDRLGRLASGLAGMGVTPGDVVAVMDWDSHRYHECYFAIPMAGAVLQTVNLRLSPEQIAFTLVDTGASTLLINQEFLPLIEKLADQLPHLSRIVLLSDKDALPETRLPVEAEYEALLASSSPGYDFPDLDENTWATTFHTSGTTGDPKGLFFSHRQLVLHSMAGLMEYGLCPSQGRFHRDDVYMPMTPMFHVHAWGCPYTCTASGVKQVYPGRYSIDTFLRLIKTEGVTFTHCVPTILQMLLAAPASKDVDLSGIKMVIGGSALPHSLARAALERGIDIFAGYGMSEACPSISVSHVHTNHLTGDPDQEVEYRTPAGIAVPLVDLRVVSPDMKDVPHDGKTPGEIVVRAPWLAGGYLNNLGASEQLWSGGYMHTGDVGVMDAEGCLHIVDRIKDVIKTGGEWISSSDLENIILEKSGISLTAVIGLKHEKWGERPFVLVVVDPDATDSITKEDVIAHVSVYAAKGIISRYAIPEHVEFVPSLPLASTGKVDKKSLRKKYSDWFLSVSA